MITYTYRCKACKTDWLRQFRITETPPSIQCPECPGHVARKVITSSKAPIFSSEGFPGNDMKHLSGTSAGTVGRKPTHKEFEYAEKQYPGLHDTNTHMEQAQDEYTAFKSGSKHGDFGKR